MINNFYTAEEIQEKVVIDDFAKYVARNGAEYELMTKHKQLGNPMFSFLFGGRLSDYYRHKLEEERNILEGHDYSYQHETEYSENNMMLSYAPSSNQYQHSFDFTQNEYFQSDDTLRSMKDKLEQQRILLRIMQEENYRVLSESQQHMNDESVNINKNKIVQCMSVVDMYRLYQTKQKCQEHHIDYESMEKCMDAILGSCTKDNICSGKNWVIEHCSNGNNHYPLCMYLLAKVSISSLFNERLHVVYFINDLLHHCKRKNSYNLLEALESVIVPIYSLCVFIADDDGKTKLNKVLSLWETNSYTKKELLDTMRGNHLNPLSYLNNWFDSEINSMHHEEEEGSFHDLYLTNEQTISHIFADARLRLANMEANYNQMKYELNVKEETLQMEIYQLERRVMEIETNKTSQDLIHRDSINEESLIHDPGLLDSVHHTNYNCFQENQNSEFQFHMPDISRPPPGFSITDQIDMLPDINVANIPDTVISDVESNKHLAKQSIPYWRLPAALMVAHIHLSQYEYDAIDPTEIKLPQLKPPSKRLLDISNNFYQLPSHDRPRDTDGWERLSLHDFLKAKEKAKIGEIIDDFISSLHLDKNDDEDYDYTGYDESAACVQYNEYEDLSDFRRNFPPPGTLNNDYRHNQLLTPQFNSTNFSPRINNQRSLLGNPWEEYSPKPFTGNLDSSCRSFNYNNGSSRPISLLGNVPRGIPQKIVPLMSLGLPTNLKRSGGIRSSKRGTYSRNSDDSYNERKRSRRRYSSRSRSKSRSGSRSKSRSRSQSTVYSRSRSRSYSRSRSNSRSRSRSRSRSSQSSHASDNRPYKGGFIARKRSKSRSRSLSRSPKPRSSLDANYTQSSLMQNLPDRRVWSGMRSELIHPDVKSQLRQEDPFSRFRQNKSASYSEWMKDRVVRRPYEEETNDNF